MNRPAPAGPAASGTVLILGATSMIARGIAGAFARAGYNLVLAARDCDEARRIASDIRLRHDVDANAIHFDALEVSSHEEFIESIVAGCGEELAGAVVAFGMMGDAERARRDGGHASEIATVIYVGAVSLLTSLATFFEKKKSGFIVGISSVAGDRGRQSNYVYGSAKGAFALFLQGLRNRLHPAGVRVLTVKPGFIDTRMTFGEVAPGKAAHPEAVGVAILKALDRNKSVIYVPWFWRYIMLVIRSIPEPIFKRLRL